MHNKCLPSLSLAPVGKEKNHRFNKTNTNIFYTKDLYAFNPFKL